MESAEKAAFYTKRRAAIRWKMTNERASLPQSLSCMRILRARLKVLMKVASGVDRKESGLAKEWRIYHYHTVEHRHDFVKDEVQWLNQKQETGY